MEIYLSLNEAIKSYENSISEGEQILLDTVWHQFFTERLHQLLSDDQRILIERDSVIEDLSQYLMRARSKAFLLKNIREDYQKFVRLVEYLKDESISITTRIRNSLGKNSKYGIAQGSYFFISQLLAGLYPMKFTICTDEIKESLRLFGLVESNFKVKSVDTYIEFNNICTNLYEKFENMYNFNLSYIHNFLWHYFGDYLKCGDWAVNVENSWYYNNSDWHQYVVKFKQKFSL